MMSRFPTFDLLLAYFDFFRVLGGLLGGPPPHKGGVHFAVLFGSDNSCTTPIKKNSLNIKLWGGIFLGHPGPRRQDIPDKNCMQVAFFCCFRQGVAGMSRDLGRDVPDLEQLYARKLWADFSYPKI